MNTRFRPTDTLEDMIMIVNSNPNLFFRLGVWGEHVEGKEHAEGKGLICEHCEKFIVGGQVGRINDGVRSEISNKSDGVNPVFE